MRKILTDEKSVHPHEGKGVQTGGPGRAGPGTEETESARALQPSS